MAISSTRGTKKTIDELVLDAWKYAGMVPVDTNTTEPQVAAKLSFGRRMLDIILDQMANVVDARVVDFYDVTMVASQQTYTLPEEVIDVVGEGIYIPASESSTETYSSSTPVRSMSREQWHMLTSKDSTGTPVMMYAHRGDEDAYTIDLKVWPLPDEALGEFLTNLGISFFKLFV